MKPALRAALFRFFESDDRAQTRADLAGALGISDTTAWRITTGVADLSSEQIRVLLQTYPELRRPVHQALFGEFGLTLMEDAGALAQKVSEVKGRLADLERDLARQMDTVKRAKQGELL